MGYSLRLTARFIICASSHRQDSTYHLCYSRGGLAETINSSLGPQKRFKSEETVAQWIYIECFYLFNDVCYYGVIGSF